MICTTSDQPTLTTSARWRTVYPLTCFVLLVGLAAVVTGPLLLRYQCSVPWDYFSTPGVPDPLGTPSVERAVTQ